MRKKSTKSSSSDSSSSSGSQMDAEEDVEQSLYDQENKVKTLALQYPGALSAQTLTQMRSSLLQGQGFEDDSAGGFQGIALQYFRTHLHHKASGPIHRELLTLSSAIDSACRGRIAQTVDVLSQRLKAAESTLQGVHWSVARKLEVIPSEVNQLSGANELRDAQKESYMEHKTRMLAGQPDGRWQRTQKGGGKGKGQGKEDSRKGKDNSKGKKGNEASKKREDGGGKA